MTHNLSGSIKRWIVLLLPVESVLDAHAMADVHARVPADARVTGAGVELGGQFTLLVESVDFTPVPHGGTVPCKTVDSLPKRKK